MKTLGIVFACILLAAGCGAAEDKTADVASSDEDVCPDCGEVHGSGFNHTQDLFTDDDRAEGPQMVFASHILLPFVGSAQYTGEMTRDEALALMESIRDSITTGQITFEDAALRHSSCPSSQNKGFLGSFPRGAMVPEFEDIAFNMDEGDISEAFETEFGYHIVWRHNTIRASHILVGYAGSTPDPAVTRTREEALEFIETVQDSLNAGMDFAEAAGSWSDCPSSEAGGDLNRFSVNLMDKDFETAAFALEPGERSEIVETPFGFHIILRTE